jgi:hypothetical protein
MAGDVVLRPDDALHGAQRDSATGIRRETSTGRAPRAHRWSPRIPPGTEELRWSTGRMFLLFGTRATPSVAFVVAFLCGHCGTLADQSIVRWKQKVTVFFIPLFSFGTQWSIACSNCGMETPLSKDQAEHSLEWASTHGYAVA